MRPTTHRLDRNLEPLPAVIKVYGEPTKKKHRDYRHEAVADLGCTNSPQGSSSGCYAHEAGRTCVRPLFCTSIALLLQNTEHNCWCPSLYPWPRRGISPPNMRLSWRRRSFPHMCKVRAVLVRPGNMTRHPASYGTKLTNSNKNRSSKNGNAGSFKHVCQVPCGYSEPA